MNVSELLAALQQAGVSERMYGIVGDTASGGQSGEGSLYLEQAPDGRWVQGGYERGVSTPERWFDSEDEACRYVYEALLRAANRVPRRMTDAEWKQSS